MYAGCRRVERKRIKNVKNTRTMPVGLSYGIGLTFRFSVCLVLVLFMCPTSAHRGPGGLLSGIHNIISTLLVPALCACHVPNVARGKPYPSTAVPLSTKIRRPFGLHIYGPTVFTFSVQSTAIRISYCSLE